MVMTNEVFEKCAVDGEVILTSEAAPPPSTRTEEVLDDEEIIEADRDVGATMSDRVRRHSGSGAIVCVWSHISEGMRTRAPEHRHAVHNHRTS
jgi:hypothetical protein